jgi:hypothetical protein
VNLVDTQAALSVNGVPIRLTAERWRHISEGHPDLANNHDDVLAAIRSPDLVQRGDLSTLLAAKRMDDLYLVVVYRELTASDGFVVTAYRTRRLRERDVAWRS